MSVTAFADAAVLLNGSECDTLAAAIEQAGTTKSTITLTEDVIVTDTLTILKNQNIIFDFGQYALTCEKKSNDFSVIANYGTLHMASGTISACSDIIRNFESGTLIVGDESKQPEMIGYGGRAFICNLGGEVTVNDVCMRQKKGDLAMILNQGGHAVFNAAEIYEISNPVTIEGGVVDVEKGVHGNGYMVTVKDGVLNLNCGNDLLLTDIAVYGESADAVLNINSGSYKCLLNIMAGAGEEFEASVNINGGVFGGVDLMYMCAIGNVVINITGGNFAELETELYDDSASINISGGTFTNSDALAKYLAEDKKFDENGTVININDRIKLDAAEMFVYKQTGEEAGYYFNVSKAVDEKTTAVAVFTAEEKTLEKTLDISSVEGEGTVEFSILLLNAPSTVTGRISYK